MHLFLLPGLWMSGENKAGDNGNAGMVLESAQGNPVCVSSATHPRRATGGIPDTHTAITFIDRGTILNILAQVLSTPGGSVRKQEYLVFPRTMN